MDCHHPTKIIQNLRGTKNNYSERCQTVLLGLSKCVEKDEVKKVFIVT